MKKISAIALLFSFIYGAAPIDKNVYDGKFDSLTKPREGLSNEQIMEVKDPFYTNRSNNLDAEQMAAEEDTLGYKLQGIMDSKAKINSKWYDLGDNIGSYKLIQIDENSVTVANKNGKQVEIKMSQGSRNVIITYK